MGFVSLSDIEREDGRDSPAETQLREPQGFVPLDAGRDRSWGEAAADTGVQLAEGVNTILGAVPNLVAPESKAAAFFRDNADFWRDRQSASLQKKVAKADEAISRAGEDGVIAQMVEATSQYFDDPALAARFVVTNLPSVIPGVGAAKLSQAAALAKGASAVRAAKLATTAAGATNALLNAGGARGEAFEDIKSTLIQQGYTLQEAEELAIRDSRVVAAVGGLTGFISGKTGLEGSIVGKVGVGSAARAGGRALATELAGEQIEEVTPKVVTNLQASRYDDRPIGKDVGRTIVETGIGSGPGAVIAGGTTGLNVLRNEASALPTTAPARAEATSQTPTGFTPIDAVQPAAGAGAQPSTTAPAAPAVRPAAPPASPDVRLAELELLAQSRDLTDLELTEAQDLVRRLDDLDPVDAPRAPTAAPEPIALVEPTEDAASLPDSQPGFPAEPSELPIAAREEVAQIEHGTDQVPVGFTPLSDQESAQVAGPVVESARSVAPAPDTLSLQNRDRSRAASVAQMADIARNPDYMRLATSRTPEAGAPMVFAVGDELQGIPDGNAGRTDVAVMSDGQRVPFRYAVVDASTVEPSNFVDGRSNPAYGAKVFGTLKALNNGRTAGLRAAYEEGTAEQYRAELITDAQAHGVPVEAIERTPNPILVRIYSEQSNTPDMAAKSQGQSLGMSPVEQAIQDASLIDSGALAVLQPGELASAGNRDFVRAFVGRVKQSGQDVAGLMTADGTLSPAGRQRMQAALMQAAYGDAELVEELFDSLDTEIKSIGEALRAVAGEWANMRDSARLGQINPDADITDNLVQAVNLVRRARRDRKSLYDLIRQPDLMTGQTPDLLTIGALRMFYSGSYMVRALGRDAMIGMLRDYARAAMTTAAGADMFGEQVSAGQILSGFESQGDLNAQDSAENRSRAPTGGQVAVGSADDTRESAPRYGGDEGSAGAGETSRRGSSYAQSGEGRAQGDGREAQADAGTGQPRAAEGDTRESVEPAAKESPAEPAPEPVKKEPPRTADRNFWAYAKEQGHAPKDVPVGSELHTRLKAEFEALKAGKARLKAMTGKKLGEGWAEFTKAAGALGVPRADMPQIKAEHRGALTQFLAARGITHQAETDLDAVPLRPTQAEFSTDKVKAAQEFEGGDRAILISADSYVLDGHHQWLANLAQGLPIRAIRFDAPMADLLPLAREFPSAGVADGAMLTQPSAAEVVDQQERVSRADELDARAQVQRESEAGAGMFDLAREDGRQDTTGDIFAQPQASAEVSRPERAAPKPKKEQPKAQAAANEDVGEQLYANRRNFTGRGIKWDDVRDLNDTLKVKEVTKAKVWPRPDYEKLVADGLPPVVARLVKQVYDGLSAGPNITSGKAPTDADLQRFIDTLAKVREGLFAFVNDRQRVGAFAQGVLGAIKRDASAIGPVSLIDMAREAMDPQAVASVLLRQVWPEEYTGAMRPFARGTTANGDLALIGGNKALAAMQFVREDLRKWVSDLENGWPAKREAWQVQGYRVLGPDEYVLDTYDGKRGVIHYIRPKQGRGSWARSEPFAGGKFALVLDGGSFAQEFETREAAIEAAREKVRRQAGVGQDVRGTNIEEAERMGPARRQEGEDITSQRLMDTFGFRGVNFGREGWINQAERQAYLNQAFDGLMDLADVLGVPPKAMSLDGKLGIAFGAQGKGRFAAHFVPGYNEINLTRTKGAGTLAHEWGHALDHHFALQASLEKDAEPFLSEHAHKGDKSDRMVFEGGKYVSKKDIPTFGDGIRPEIVQAFRAIRQAMEKRNESPGEAQMRRQSAQESAGLRLGQWLKVARSKIEDSTASNKADLLAEFDQHAEKLRQGDTGDGHEKSGKQVFSSRVAAVRNLIKDATGRVWSLDESSGLESVASYLRSLAGKQDADAAHEPQNVSTQYQRDSRAMDAQKGGKAYWGTPTEMFARAFELYVHDALSQRGQRNTFLTDAEARAAKPAQIPDTSSATARASGAMRDLYLYPVGKERETLREAFDSLVGQVKTRATEQGVTVFNRKDGTYTDRNGRDAQPTPQDLVDIEALEAIVDDGNRGAVDAGRARRARDVRPFRWVRLPDSDGLADIAAVFGKRVVGFEVPAGVLTREFGFFNGVTRPGRDNRIFINAKSDRPHLAVLGHELAHQFKRQRPDLYADLVAAIRPYVRAKEYGAEFATSSVARFSYPQGASPEQRDAAVREEFVGEVLSDGFMDKGFWRAVGESDATLLQRLASFLGELIERIRTAVGISRRTERFLTDFDKVMQIAGQALGEYGKPVRDAEENWPAAFNRMGGTQANAAFQRWFGESKIIEAEGQPMVLYHGTTDSFDAFDPNAIGRRDSGFYGRGFYFTDSPWLASRYVGGSSKGGTVREGANVLPVYLHMVNPFYTSEESLTADEIAAIKQANHDGIIAAPDNMSTPDGSSPREFVVFRPEQIKSAIGNRGTFDPDSADIRFLRNNQAGPHQPIGPGQQNAWTRAKAKVQELASPAAIDRLLYEFQDKLIDLRRLREHIKVLGGTITDLNDAYLGEELYHKRLAKRTADFLDKELKPLLGEMRARAIKLPEFEQYLHARHAPEANRLLAQRNPNKALLDSYRSAAAKTVRNLEDQLQRAKAQGSDTKAIEDALTLAKEEAAMWMGAQAFNGPEQDRLALSGMSDADAKAYMDGLPQRKRQHMDDLAVMVDKMQTKTLSELEGYGLMDRATLSAWQATYKHYVPLHRDEAKPDSDRHPIGQGFSVKGSGTKSRVGSNEKVTNILAHVAMQREAALTRGEKNNVVKKLYLMAAQNPDDDFWMLDAPPKVKTVDPRNGTVRTTIDPTYKHRPNVLMVRIGGRDKSIVFNEHNPSAVRLAESMKNLDIGDLHVVLGLVSKGTRWFASVNTQYNPIFGLINFARDVQAGLLNLSTTPLAGRQKDVAKHVLTAMRAIYRERRGKASRNGRWTTLWDEFEQVGGTTGYRDLFADAEDRAKALVHDIESLDRGQVSKAAHAIVDWLSDYNEVMENAVRLAAYKVAIDQGMGKEQAASLAKNLTVNFNRKGRQTRELGALYAFFNAALQGTARMVETLRGPIGKRIMYGGVALGAFNTLIGMAMMGAGDDDEPDNWDKIPEFIKERSVIIPLGREDYLTIPMPLGFHVFPNIGRMAVEFAFGEGHKSAGRRVGELLSVLVDAFNPLGGAQNLGQMVSPTVIDPVVALMQNRDWTGRPIYREDFSDLDPTPGHTRTKDSASSVSRGLAEAINTVTGGSEYRPGAWSPTPDQLDYVFGQITGGLGRELIKVNQALTSAVTGDELPPYKVPLVGRLYGSTRGASGQSERYYENLRLVNEVQSELKGRQRKGDDPEGFERREPLTAVVVTGNEIEKRIRDLRAERRAVSERKENGYQAMVRNLDFQIGMAMNEFNNEVARARKAGTN
jgi:Large polyvalent protein associated domain 38/ddrB-like ParB superfamily domain/ADP-Ribosyltransferase in polyvalent proteins/Large polyvalent protein-associated domain 1